MIIAGAALIIMVLDRFPVLVWLGAVLLGWIAGDVIETDPAVQPVLHKLLDGTIALRIDAQSAIFGISPQLNLEGELDGYIASVLGAIIVVVAGSIWRKRKLKQLENLALPDAGAAIQPINRS
jgi:predicted tellurium resistance membrane protein TerC